MCNYFLNYKKYIIYREGNYVKNNELDNIDKKIITMLQENARVSLKEIAEKVFLSSPAVSVRIENLVDNGYIQGFHAYVDPVKLGYHIKAFINLEVSPVDKKEFYPYIRAGGRRAENHQDRGRSPRLGPEKRPDCRRKVRWHGAGRWRRRGFPGGG